MLATVALLAIVPTPLRAEELTAHTIELQEAPITEADDWTAFHEKLARVETARVAWGL